MARVNVQMVVLAAVMAVAVFSVPAIAARHAHGSILRQPFEKHLNVRHFFPRRGWNGILCIPDVSELLEDHEGRNECAYDHPKGFRAVGVGYNLDENQEQRRSELSTLLLDYDQVYDGKTCLNDVQISALLLLDAQRALERASKNVKNLHDFCCPVQAVFADIQHSSGAARDFPQKDLQDFIEKASSEEYRSAAHELGRTDWCNQKENEKRCNDNAKVIKDGC